MEPPNKRRRLLGSDNPDVELHERRVRSHKKLKSTFESIFEKYSKDFSDVGDVIDFTTNEIVVDNQHIVNMTDEKDLGAEDGWWADGRVDVSSPDTMKRRPSDVVPNSQDVESSDDDPLGLPEHVVSSTTPSLSQRESILSKASQPRDGNRSIEKQHYGVSPLAGRRSSSATWTLDVPLDLRNYSTIEAAWQVPPLPEDEEIQAAPSSPSPSLECDLDSVRSESPPVYSIWTPVARRHRPRASDTPAAPWTTQENRLLRNYKTTTDQTFEDICNHFPSRTPDSLRKRWQSLNQKERAIRQNPQRNAWTREEDQLLRHLKTSTDKTYAEIQGELSRHPIGALQMRWYKIRQKLDHPLQDNCTLPSDPASPSNSRELLAEKVPCQIDSANKLSPLESPHAWVECHPDSTEAERKETLISLRALESDQSESCYEDELGGQKEFPSGMVVPDSQDGEGTQCLLHQSPNPQACLQRPFSRPNIHYNDNFAESTSLSLAKLDSVSDTAKLKAYPMHRQSLPATTTANPLKLKRTLENDERNAKLPLETHVSPRPSVDQGSPKSGNHDSRDTGMHCKSSTTSKLHQEYFVPNSSAAYNVKPNDSILDSVNQSPSDLTFAKTLSGSPAKAETPKYSGKGRSNDPIEISSSPSSQTSFTEAKARHFAFYNDTQTSPADDIVLNLPSDELSMLETRDEIILPLSNETRDNRRGSRSTVVTTNDESPSYVEQNPETSRKEYESWPESTDASEAMGISQDRIDPIPPSSGNGSSQLEHHQGDDLVSRSGRLTERLIQDVSGCSKPRAIDESSVTPVSTNETFRGKITVPLNKRASVQDQVHIANPMPPKYDPLKSVTDIHETKQSFSGAGDILEKLPDVELPSIGINLPARDYTRVEKPIDEIVKASAEAEAIHCQYFYRVEIPKLSTPDSTSSVIAPLSQEHFALEHESPPAFLPSKDEAHAWKSQSSIHREGLEHDDFPNVATDEEHRYTEDQIQPPATAPDLLCPTIEYQAAEDIDEPSKVTQTSGCHPQDWVLTGNQDSTAHDPPLDVLSSNQKQDSIDENDEDDLHLFLQPAVTLRMGRPAQQMRKDRSAHPDDADLSDDELSTPVKVTQKQIETTHVRSLLTNR
ncbi:MAG: hypothetical protein Q9216_006707 [Gyalolechia sp. 2 TL-2023]